MYESAQNVAAQASLDGWSASIDADWAASQGATDRHESKAWSQSARSGTGVPRQDTPRLFGWPEERARTGFDTTATKRFLLAASAACGSWSGSGDGSLRTVNRQTNGKYCATRRTAGGADGATLQSHDAPCNSEA